MSRSWARRGQVEPVAALVAVAAVCAGLALYAGALADALPETRDRNHATVAVDRVADETAEMGVVDPTDLSAAGEAVPEPYRVNASVTAADRRWRVGPPVPPTADVASRRVSVATGPGRVRPGRLRVAVWK